MVFVQAVSRGRDKGDLLGRGRILEDERCLTREVAMEPKAYRWAYGYGRDAGSLRRHGR